MKWGFCMAVAGDVEVHDNLDPQIVVRFRYEDPNKVPLRSGNPQVAP